MNDSPPLTLRVGAKADPGKVRKENQDRISRFRTPFGEVFIVADGMGGHEGGAKAAEMLVNGLEKYLADQPPQTPPEQALQTAASRINTDIYQRASSGEPKTAKMGSTSVLALIDGRRVLIAHAGDSRAYLMRDGKLSRLTRDHTVVQRMLDKNMLNEEEARHHPDASVITRAFGQKPEMEMEIGAPFDLRDGDRILLCSDGLCGYVDDPAIERVLQSGGDAQAATDALIDLALQAGGEDNVSVQLLATPGAGGPGAAVVGPLPTPPPPPVAVKAASKGRPLMVGALILIALLAGALIPWKKVFRLKDGGEETPVPGGEETTPGKKGHKKGKPSEKNPAGQDTPADTSKKIVGLGEDKPSDDDTQEQDLEIYFLGKDNGNKLKDLLADYGKISVYPPMAGFKEGRVYYREDSRDQALAIVKELNREIQDKASQYDIQKWPAGLAKTFEGAQVVVALRAAAKAPAARTLKAAGQDDAVARPAPKTDKAALDQPRITVLLATGSKAPPIPVSLTKKYPADWKHPQKLPTKEGEAVWAAGSVYYRPVATSQAGDIATEFGYSPRPWTSDVATAFVGTDILVVLKPAEDTKDSKKKHGDQP